MKFYRFFTIGVAETLVKKSPHFVEGFKTWCRWRESSLSLIHSFHSGLPTASSALRSDSGLSPPESPFPPTTTTQKAPNTRDFLSGAGCFAIIGLKLQEN